MTDSTHPALEQAWSLAGRGQLREAISILEQTEHRENNDRILGALSHLYYRLKQYQPAELAARTSLRLNPRNQLALCTLGELAIRRDRSEDAVAYFRDAYRFNPQNAYISRRLASLLIRTNQSREAITILENARGNHPEDRSILDMLALSYLMLGEDERVQMIRKVIQDLPTGQSGPSDELADTLRHLPIEAALKQIESILRIPSFLSDPHIRHAIADVMFSAGRFADALVHREAAISMSTPTDWQKLRHAQCLIRLERHEDAMIILDGNRHLEGMLQYRILLYEALAGSGRADEAMIGIIRDLDSNPRNRTLRALLNSMRRRGVRFPVFRPGKEEPDPGPDA